MSGFRLAAAYAAAALAASCAKPQTIRVGLVTGLTGRHYDLGLSSRNGVELAVKEINAAGGVKGRPIELLVRDDGQDAEQARRAVTELVQAGVVLIIGHATSAMAEATLPIVDRERVLMLSPTATSPSFRGKDDYFATVGPSAADGARALASYVIEKRIARKVTAVCDHSNRAYTDTWFREFQASLRAAGGDARAISFTSGQVPSMAGIAEEALAGQADGVLLLANALDTAALCQQIRKRSAVPVFGASWGFTNDLAANGGRAVEGALFSQGVNMADRSPRFLIFKQAYLDRYRRAADFAAVLSYEAMKLAASALERDATRDGVRRALLGIGTFDGLQGAVRLSPTGDAERTYHIMTIRDGQVAVAE